MPLAPIQGQAKRLRIYIGDSDLWRGKSLAAVLLEQLKKEGLAGATVFRGVAGFGAHSRIHTAAILDLSTDLPVVIEVIDTPEKIQHALETVSPMVHEGLITLEGVEVLAYTHRLLHPLPADRPVREIMTRDPVAIRQDQTILAAWEIMLAHNLKALPVLDTQNHVVGLITHDDLLERAGLNARLAVALRLDEDSLRAEMEILRSSPRTLVEVMSRPPLTIQPDDPIGLAAERLVGRGVTRLPVVDPDGRLVGIVSRLDLLRQVMDVPETPHSNPQAGATGRLAAEVMQAEVPLVPDETDLAGVIASFLSSGEHRVIVVDAQGRPVGIISDSDVVGRIQPAHRRGVLGALRGWAAPPVVSVSARELMSPGVETILADTPVVEAVQRMVSAQRKWLVVVDAAGKPVGLIDREIALHALVR
jgi:CBS-domain-containing membrane protein